MQTESRLLTMTLGDQQRKVLVSSDDVDWSTVSAGDEFSMGGEGELWIITKIDLVA